MGSEVEDTFPVLEIDKKEHIDWSVYAEHYDELCSANPAYLANIDDLISRLGSWNLPDDAKICDVGAGTGTFISVLADKMPNADLHHVDFDLAMTARAKKKYESIGLNVSIYDEDVRLLHFPPAKFDLSICVNTLYSIPEHDAVLRKMRDWTKPNGRLYIIDFGRKVALLDWAVYLLRNRIKDLGFRKAIKWYRENAENLAQNRKGAKAQSEGTYWLHSTKEFHISLEKAGWRVDEIKTCYRDFCDLAVCSKPS